MWGNWSVPTRPQWLNKTETSFTRKTVILDGIFGWIFVSLVYPLVGKPSVGWHGHAWEAFLSPWVYYELKTYHWYTIKELESVKSNILYVLRNIYFGGKSLMCFRANNLWLKFSHFQFDSSVLKWKQGVPWEKHWKRMIEIGIFMLLQD